MAKFAIVAIDVTEHYDAEEGAGRIMEVFTSDLVPVHLCEITPSYELSPLRMESENTLPDDKDTEMQACLDWEPTYIHCSSLAKYVHEVDTGYEDYEEFVEYHRCNHAFSAFAGVPLA